MRIALPIAALAALAVLPPADATLARIDVQQGDAVLFCDLELGADEHCRVRAGPFQYTVHLDRPVAAAAATGDPVRWECGGSYCVLGVGPYEVTIRSGPQASTSAAAVSPVVVVLLPGDVRFYCDQDDDLDNHCTVGVGPFQYTVHYGQGHAPFG